MREFTRAEMSEKFQTELEEAKEVARYELEQEHLENLRQLEASLGQNHAEQLRGLAELQQKHVDEIHNLKAAHVTEIERLKKEVAQAYNDQLSAVSLDAEREVSQVKEELDEAHSKEIDAFKDALEREKSRVLALEAVQASIQAAHHDIVQRMQENFDKEMGNVRSNVDSAHGEQVQELQSLLEERHKMVKMLEKYFGNTRINTNYGGCTNLTGVKYLVKVSADTYLYTLLPKNPPTHPPSVTLSVVCVVILKG